MKEYLAVTKGLSDESRVRLLFALRGGELCVCQLIELLGLAPSTVSRHLAILSQADLVEYRKSGRWVYYRLPRRPVSDVAARLTKETFRALAASEVIQRDAQHLERIRDVDPEELCRNLLTKS